MKCCLPLALRASDQWRCCRELVISVPVHWECVCVLILEETAAGVRLGSKLQAGGGELFADINQMPCSANAFVKGMDHIRGYPVVNVL
jgi:hypothetical protein